MAGTVGRYEAAFGADRSGMTLADEFAWTDLTARTQGSEAVINRGRMAQQQQVQPATLDQVLDNGDGALTPRHPASTFYPNVEKGLAIRHSVAVGDPYLLCDGSGIGATTPDSANLDIVSDLALAVEVVSPLRYRAQQLVGTQGSMLVAKWTNAGDQRSYRLYVSQTTGNLVLIWSVNGTDAGQRFQQCPVPKPAQGPYSVGAYLDVNNGLGGYTVRFYAWKGDLDDLLANVADAQIDEVVTTAGTTSIHSGTAALTIGGTSESSTGRYPGGISQARVYAGTLGTSVRANPDFRAQAVGAAGFTDAAGAVWTVGAAGEILKYRQRFYGELGGSYPTWPGASVDNTSRARWSAAGVLRRMRQNDKPLDSPMRRTVGSPANVASVHGYWPLDDGSRSSQAESPVPGVAPLVPGGAVTFASDATCPGSDPVINIAENQPYGWNATVPDPGGSPGFWRAEWFVKVTTPATAPAQTIFQVVGLAGSIGTVYMGINDTTLFVVVLDSLGGFLDQTVAGAPIPDTLGHWTYYSLKLDQNGGNVDMTLDWIPLEGPGQGDTYQMTDSYAGTFGRMASIRNLATSPPGGISFGNFIVVTDQNFGWLANADTGWDTESATQRIHRLCKEQGILCYVDGPHGQGPNETSPLHVGQADGVQALGPQRSLPLLALLEEAAKADYGYLGEDYSTGGLTYRTGATLVNQEPRLTVGTEVTKELAPADDDQGLINDLTAERLDGSRRRLKDDESIAKAGPYEANVLLNVGSDDQLADQASIRLTIATWPEMRYGQVPIELSKDSALWPDWMQAAPGDLIVADSLPDTHPTPELRQLLDGYQETISAVRWRVLANVTPEGPWAAGVLDTDGTPDTDMRALDTDGSELSAGINTVATSLSVAITDGPLWTTVAANYPLDIGIGGEQMTVTAVSGGASPQTFTVTRSVNGVVKSHSAGADVRLWQPLTLTI
jgi:hypothetical protein